MDVIALVGPSGTGKSHRALIVAHEHKADAIIDDGILIQDGKIIAGHSAKREASKIMAVRRAIFSLPGHAEEVRHAIETLKPKRILVLGTSENMVHKIVQTLSLRPIREIIRIEDIATQEEMDKAHQCRMKEGKHIIPVPTIELKPHFSGYLIDPLESFFKKSRTNRRKLGEKSIVRPIFSYYGKLVIDDSVITAIVRHVARDKFSTLRVLNTQIRRLRQGHEEKGLEITLEIALSYGNNVIHQIENIQVELKSAIEQMTGMAVERINITIKKLLVSDVG